MGKKTRIEIAKETLEIIEKGFYQRVFGQIVSIKEEPASKFKNCFERIVFAV